MILFKVCFSCGYEDSVATMVTSLASRLERCHVCGVVLCMGCLTKSCLVLPEG